MRVSEAPAHSSDAVQRFLSSVIAIAAWIGRSQAPQELPQQFAGSPFHYPEELWEAGIERETGLAVFVNPQGVVEAVVVERGSGYEAFDSAAVRGAPDVQLDPELWSGEPTGVWVLLPVKFKLPVGDTAASH